MSRATLRIDADSLLALPAGAVYEAKSGQAEARVERKARTLYVTATCDSIERQVELFENLYIEASREADRYKAMYEDAQHTGVRVETHKETRGAGPVRTALWGFLAGLLAGIAISAGGYILKKEKENGKE